MKRSKFNLSAFKAVALILGLIILMILSTLVLAVLTTAI